VPAILERLVGQLQGKGMVKSQAFAVATSQLQKAGDLKKGSQDPTPKGVKRGAMTPAARAKDRTAKASTTTKDPNQFKYDASTNRATKK
jgi:hypothetical protein